jgi:hypothetical protein
MQCPCTGPDFGSTHVLQLQSQSGALPRTYVLWLRAESGSVPLSARGISAPGNEYTRPRPEGSRPSWASPGSSCGHARTALSMNSCIQGSASRRFLLFERALTSTCSAKRIHASAIMIKRFLVFVRSVARAAARHSAASLRYRADHVIGHRETREDGQNA